MKRLMHAEVSHIIKAIRKDVFEASRYENIPRWSKKFKNLKVVSKEGNTVKAYLETVFLA